MADPKTNLTFEERITVAWAHHVKGIHQHTLAALFNVNAGRVAEACTAIKEAATNPKAVNQTREAA